LAQGQGNWPISLRDKQVTKKGRLQTFKTVKTPLSGGTSLALQSPAF